MSLYDKRGVSAQKEEVHAATKNLDKGLYERSFCRVYPDFFNHDRDWASVMHADGAGTKTILGYLYWKETGDLSVWKGIAQDAIVMNLDDLLCTGIYDSFLFSSTIDRNKNRITGEVLEALISGHQEFFEQMKAYGVHIHYMGGETADVGDLVGTVAVNGTMAARWPRAGLISNEKIKPGNLLIGLASFGKANYENAYNSGIASNGLTSARHDMLDKSYGERFPETYDNSLEKDVVYAGTHRMTDKSRLESGEEIEIGRLLLSPTRTFAPVLKILLEEHFEKINGLVHCSGGGQTKCLKYLPANTRVIKDNLWEPPPVFQLIQGASRCGDREMYQVFNMGTRMEIYCDEKNADLIIAVSKSLGVDARVIGRVEESGKKELLINLPSGQLVFH